MNKPMTSIERSYLFVPGNRPERFNKAMQSGANAIIIDLEDAVAPAEKSVARLALSQWVEPSHRIIVRINSIDTPWFEDDTAILNLPGIVAVMLPKAEHTDAIAHLAAKGVQVLPLIETAVGVANARSLAKANGVYRLAFGSIDLQVDLGISGDDLELLAYRSELVLASRLAKLISPIDGVCTSIDDMQELHQDVVRSRKLGFGAKLCIHPKQINTVNLAFLPSQQEITWAHRVLAEVGSAGGAAVAVDGKMVDRPVMLRAIEIVKASEQITRN